MHVEKLSQIYNAYKARFLNQEIHPNDVMFNTGGTFYFSVGESALNMILQGLFLSWLPNVDRILDLPCGHGRVGRHLRAAFPDAEIHYCEIDQEGADFCAETFGGKALYSEPDLTKVNLPHNIDVIWVGSLFTHTNLETTTAWLGYLAEHLSEHGILVATFHGMFVTELAKVHPGFSGGADWGKVLRECEAVGYGFATYPENHGVDGYGVSLSKASKIMDIATAIPNTRVGAYTERGWANNHDVLVLVKNDRLKSFESR